MDGSLAIPKTLSDAIKFYADPDNCIEVVKEMRWLDGQPVCPYCGAKRSYWFKLSAGGSVPNAASNSR